LTAYNTVTGIIPEYRKKGIAKRIFNEFLSVLRENKIQQCLLEVICSNTGAYKLYKKSGFEVVREIDYYIDAKSKLTINKKLPDADLRIEKTKNPEWDWERPY
jgi:ribosomal protein S18 acetylase RimI-like enzyme